MSENHHSADGDLRTNLRHRRTNMRRNSSIFGSEDLRINLAASKNLPTFEETAIFEGLPFSIPDPAYRRTISIFDLRSRRSNKFSPSSIFDRRLRKPKNPPFSIFGPKEWVEDRTEGGGERISSKMGSCSTSWVGRTENLPHLPSFRPEERKTFPSSTFSTRRTKDPLSSSSSDPPPLDHWPPAPFSYLSHPKLGHPSGGAGRGAAERGRAGRSILEAC